MTTALQTLADILEKEDFVVGIRDNVLSVCSDLSYSTQKRFSYINPPDYYIVERYSDELHITFDDSAFIATNENGEEVAREEVIAWDDEAGITEQDIKDAADSMAETISYLLPEREAA